MKRAENGLKFAHSASKTRKDKRQMENVNHPAHYNREGRKECIDEMLESFGVEYVRAFCICNVFKYCYRHSRKGGEEDLKKSGWYARKFIELGGDVAELSKIQIY